MIDDYYCVTTSMHPSSSISEIKSSLLMSVKQVSTQCGCLFPPTQQVDIVEVSVLDTCTCDIQDSHVTSIIIQL